MSLHPFDASALIVAYGKPGAGWGPRAWIEWNFLQVAALNGKSPRREWPLIAEVAGYWNGE